MREIPILTCSVIDAQRYAEKVWKEDKNNIELADLDSSSYKLEQININFNIEDFAKEIRKLAKQNYDKPFDRDSKKPRAHAGDKPFDRAVIDLLSRFPVPEEVGSRPEFWNSVVLLYCADVVCRYRHARVDKNFNPENAASASVHENYLGRNWLRLFLTKSPNGYDVELAQRGDVDFWRSHIFRQKSLWSSNVVKAFLEFQFPEQDVQRLWSGRKDEDGACDGIRLFVKHLAALSSNVALEIYPQPEFEAHMQNLVTHGNIKLDPDWKKSIEKA